MSDFKERIEKLSPKRLALLALDLQSRIEQMEQQRTELIAIVGIGCRMPGAEPGPEGFWKLLSQGRDAITEIPADRWDARAYYNSDPDAPGRASTLWGGFLPDIYSFDAPFFNISRREAVSMDPQQRLLLEVCWEALEDAGHSPHKLRDKPTGIFIGISTNDYYHLLLARGESAIDAYLASGTAHSVAAGRIAYVLGFDGPAMAVDTSCSGSLVSVHLACQSLRNGECRVALAGGVNAILSPEVTIGLSKAHMMAADGRCKAFDERADGFVRSEGCGIVVLKRLSDARADGDAVLGVIRGSASNQDGRSNGLTAPNGAAQEAVIRQALANARVRPEEISYVETHGTGTALGDPIEAHALAAVFGQGRGADNLLKIGSVKSNIGHLEAAAGVAGLIKTVLALQHEQIPGNLHFKSLNPQIDWGDCPMAIAANTSPWPRGTRPRVAGVSSFGFSGTNAHLVIEESPVPTSHGSEENRPLHILTLSARNESALTNLEERYARCFAGSANQVADLCFSANEGRAPLEQRSAYLAATREQMIECLHSSPVASGRKRTRLETVFLFPGQGAQYAGMGKDLYRDHPDFRRALDECAEILKSELEEPLLEVLWGARTALLDQTIYTQPALFAVEYAVAQLWRSWGVEPSAVLGHSVGEYVAACVAGVYDLRDGLHLIARRAALMQSTAGEGIMSAVMAGERHVRDALDGLETRVSVAAVNAVESAVISGYKPEVEIAEQRLQRQGVAVKRLAVSHAFHSPQMAQIEEVFEDVARKVRFAPPRIELISSVTGNSISQAELSEPAYWRRQIRQPVLFAKAIRTLQSKGPAAFLEAGPGSTLRSLARQTITGPEAVWAGSLRRSRGEWPEVLESLAQLWVHGVEIDWAAFDRPYHRQRVHLPTYPFERQHYAIESGPRVPGGPASRPVKPANVPDSWFYNLEWEPNRHNSLPPPPESSTDWALFLSGRASLLRSEHHLDRYDDLRMELNPVCARFILAALQKAGCTMTSGSHFAISDLRARGRIAERHRMLFDRILEILVEQGILSRNGEVCTVATIPAFENPSLAIAALREKYPGFEPELEMTGRCGAALARVLQGDLDPLHVLFPDGSTKTAEAIYSLSPGPQVFNRLAGDLVAREVESRPDGKLRVLEIGAGTGGTTAYVLPHLPADRSEYVFTDVSPLFLSRAREKFKDYPFLQYRTLDIEKEPAAQGFETGQFDLVIAANVLHATADLNQTFRHIRSVLAPGGLIVLVEGTYAEPWVDLTFGLTDGWWRFRDRDLRPSYPLLSRPGWLDFLSRSGFEQPNAIQPREGSQQAVIFARAPRNPGPPLCCLILPDTSGIADSLVEQIQQAGGTAQVMRSGEPLDAYLRTASTPWTHIADLRPVGNADLAQMPAAELGQEAFRCSAAPLAALQAMVRTGSKAKLWVVTRGAQAVLPSQKDFAVTEATAWGIARCIRLEHPALWGGVVDLDPAAGNDENARACLASLLAGDPEDQTAFRTGQRYVPRLVRGASPGASPVAIRADRTYLVTGGLGGLGLRVAHWLVESGAREILLVGRTGLPHRGSWDALPPESPEAKRVSAVKAMEQLGAKVSVAAIDVSDESAVASRIAALPVGKLAGIVHAAADLAAGALLDMKESDLHAMLAAKATGTWALHRATASMNLDFFVLFSSNSSLMGAQNLGHYAAANQFLDAFAHYRGRRGLPAVSVNWGAWPHFGKTSASDRDRLYRGGLVPMPWEGALAALGQVMASDLRQIFIGDFNWNVLKSLYESQRELPLLEHISDTAAENGESVRTQQEPSASPFSRLAGSWGDERDASTLHYLTEVLASLVRTSAGQLDADLPLTDFGIDSLIALELRNRLDADFHFSISTVALLKGPTLRELARQIAAAMPRLSQGKSEPPESVSAPLAPAETSHVRGFPLSFGQRAQWVVQRLVPDTYTFNCAFSGQASPGLHRGAFERAVWKLMARHSSLRTVFSETENGDAYQRVLTSWQPATQFIDATGLNDAELKDHVIREFRRPLDLDRCVLRIPVFHRKDSDVVLFVFHHIAVDGDSLPLCLADLIELYNAELAGRAPRLMDVQPDYQEFVESESEIVNGPAGEHLWEYWKEKLSAGDLPVLALPHSRPRPAVFLPHGEQIPLFIGPDFTATIQDAARRLKTTKFHLLLSAFQTLLRIYTGQDDIVIGTSSSLRNDVKWANFVGYLVNLLPLRCQMSSGMRFCDLLGQTRERVLSALEHQSLPFPFLVERLRVRREVGCSPVFQAFFNYLTDRPGKVGAFLLGVPDTAVQFGDSVLRPFVDLTHHEVLADIMLYLADFGDHIRGYVNYNADVVDASTAQAVTADFTNILRVVLAEPDVRLGNLSMTPMTRNVGSGLEELLF